MKLDLGVKLSAKVLYFIESIILKELKMTEMWHHQM